ncbi:MAG: hypothetical protein LUG96_11075, partial [Tannerellaceae bacterium]|nr:hypothetical protein [Tannerellaceae bacterium]
SEDNEISAIDTVYDDSAVKEALADLREEMGQKAGADDFYSKEDIDGKLDEVVAGQVDMSLYYDKSRTDDLLAGKQAVLSAGENIVISEDNEISAVDTIYDDTEIRGQVKELGE